ncbi:histidine--tRNA ligase [Lacticaseibacillus saniviri]|uniref:Histidine--tRNA ligase n=1 Tax=Lacticaseibacillus saniviri JCM 17471 = DSM 24301 TaxID=1293598 RepID=A0A0R2N522_9LACO|nr:histidine--tRNA ligase [Lacticaseibacillus saniviri]KRO18170.1 Histidyl-tRNA synthetase [Lacticaseibacillus saniviri JCM 17471 = DSM 24301]MCG4282498.1 histidine--tRNA ligase [Lacticaseibacillus saniviri]
MYQRPKGTADILPAQSGQWQKIEATARQVFSRYQYQEIRTPIFENYEVFARSAGDTSDIVTKEMYTFEDKGKRMMALRPEGTAGVVRAYVENKLYGPEFTKPYKVYYMGPMFRYERPQSGRQRQFHQIGVEAFGSESPALDAETIAMAEDLLTQLGARNVKVVINTLGDPESREAYHAALIAYLTPFKDELSEDSKIRLEKNPLRILDSKDKHDQEIVANAPQILDFLSEAASAHFEAVKTYLTDLHIPFEVDATMVRGLDYYNHTIFEVMSDDPAFGGGFTTILAGGRYNGLVEELGGPATPGVGFGMGVERLLLLMQDTVVAPVLPAYIVTIDDSAIPTALQLATAIRRSGYGVDLDYMGKKAKGQFKAANKANAQLVLTLGESELETKTAQVKNMASGEQVGVSFDRLMSDFETVYHELMGGEQ